MPISNLKPGFDRRFPHPIVSIDSHTAGEPTRLLVDGLPCMPGTGMQAKREYFQHHLDHLRCLVTKEPRGHRDILAAALTEPVTPEASFGLIYMDAKRYPYLCGHATIGAVTTLLELGAIPAEQTEVVVDTPSGPMSTRATWGSQGVDRVGIETVPSFVCHRRQQLNLPETGYIEVDTACVGGFFVMVDVSQLDLGLDQTSELVPLGMRIIEAANQQLQVAHPTRPEVNSVDVVEFYAHHPSRPYSGQSVVVYGEGHVDRSPCGTGTAAKMTLLHDRGWLQPDQVYTNQSPTGTFFQARIVRETAVGHLRGVEVEIQGQASITGWHQFVLDPKDPFPQGFLL